MDELEPAMGKCDKTKKNPTTSSLKSLGKISMKRNERQEGG